MDEIEVVIIAETEAFSAWRFDEPDGEISYHLELGNVTIHFLQEEWTEFQALIRQIGDRQ